MVSYKKLIGPVAIQLLTEKERCLASIPVEQLASVIDMLQEVHLGLHGCYHK